MWRGTVGSTLQRLMALFNYADVSQPSLCSLNRVVMPYQVDTQREWLLMNIQRVLSQLKEEQKLKGND